MFDIIVFLSFQNICGAQGTNPSGLYAVLVPAVLSWCRQVLWLTESWIIRDRAGWWECGQFSVCFCQMFPSLSTTLTELLRGIFPNLFSQWLMMAQPARRSMCQTHWKLKPDTTSAAGQFCHWQPHTPSFVPLWPSSAPVQLYWCTVNPPSSDFNCDRARFYTHSPNSENCHPSVFVSWGDSVCQKISFGSLWSQYVSESLPSSFGLFL